MVEQRFCKAKAGGSNPSAGSVIKPGYRSSQTEQTVNLPAQAFVGANPTPGTPLSGVLGTLSNIPRNSPRLRKSRLEHPPKADQRKSAKIFKEQNLNALTSCARIQEDSSNEGIKNPDGFLSSVS